MLLYCCCRCCYLPRRNHPPSSIIVVSWDRLSPRQLMMIVKSNTARRINHPPSLSEPLVFVLGIVTAIHSSSCLYVCSSYCPCCCCCSSNYIIISYCNCSCRRPRIKTEGIPKSGRRRLTICFYVWVAATDRYFHYELYYYYYAAAAVALSVVEGSVLLFVVKGRDKNTLVVAREIVRICCRGKR
jgi:hypothetical protein